MKLEDAFRATLTRHWRTMADRGGPTQACIDDLTADVAGQDSATSKPTEPPPTMTTRSATSSRSNPRRATK